MKKTTCILLLLFISTGLFSQTILTENDKLASLCKVWGFLKYYHPKVSKGKLDWDKELAEHVPAVLLATNRLELSNIYLDWINSLGTVKRDKKSDKPIPDSFKLNIDLKWFDDKNLFSDTLIAVLHRIEQCKRHSKKYYAEKAYKKGFAHFKNEEPYKDSVYPSVNFRLLALFRYWNIINYYYPYKYLLDEDWNKVLTEMLPEFEYAEDTISYHLAMQELVVKLEDSHAFYGDRFTIQYFGKNFPSFQYKIIEGKVVVTGFYNDSLANRDDIQYGDVVLTVDGRSVDKLSAVNSKYITGSNESVKKRFNTYQIFNGNTDSCLVELERNGTILTKNVHRYPYAVLNYKWKPEQNEPSKLISNKIGYLDLSKVKPRQVKSVLQPLMGTDTLIMDLRSYPEISWAKMLKYLNPEKKRFALYTRPWTKHPGLFNYTKGNQFGRKNKNYYKGKIIVLMNEYTQSRGEFYCLALKTVPNVTYVGNQTAGTDGGVCTITFPGGSGTWMTHVGVYYPDGRICQRIGIVPDIKVSPTLDGIRKRKDEVLERAIEYAKTGK